MGRITVDMQKAIQVEAERFLMQHGFNAPPLSPAEAWAARNLEVTQYSLDDLLVEVNLSPDDHKKIPAMLDQNAMAVTFREGLPEQQRNWGSLHEVGHEFLPWQRELLYHCPLIWMHPRIQKEFEAEADIFAAEAFFFGAKFNENLKEGDRNLQAAIDLADNVYMTSKHATIRHYVEVSGFPCCLIIWQPNTTNMDLFRTKPLAIRYYVKSSSFVGHIAPGQIADPDGAVTKIFNEPSMDGVVEHDLTIISNSGQFSVASAQSFSNSYSVFTLIGQPIPQSQ